LLECLRPPEGFRFDRAIGTAFSLDLLALLTAPLALTFFDWEEDDGEVTADPLALLEAVRRNSDRILLFCEAGQIKVPPPTQRLVAYLEASVVEVKAPKGGAFHPKFWMLRYVSAEGNVRFRLVCLSRNLTFDRSWDVVLVLDGEMMDRQRAYSKNSPLAQLVEALPGLAIRPLQRAAAASCKELADQALLVKWTLPDGVDDLAFWPLGLQKSPRWPFAETRQNQPLLVMAPFLSAELLARLSGTSGRDVLISRPDTLAELPKEAIEGYDRVYAFDPPGEDDDTPAEASDHSRLSGLHAKLYVVDDGWNAHVFMGSANATNAAFGRNVELLIQLTGKKSLLGVEALIGRQESGQVGLVDLLQPWNGQPRPADAAALLRKQLEDELDALRRQIPSLDLSLHVESSGTDYAMTLRSAASVPDLGQASLRCWPSMLKSDRAVRLVPATPMSVLFERLTLDAVCGFVVFELGIQRSGEEATLQFACLAEVHGAPANRLDRLLASMLKDKEQLLRLIWLLLESHGATSSEQAVAVAVGAARPWQDQAEGHPIFERVLKILATDRPRLKEIGRLVEDLRRTPEGRTILPPGLTNLWDAIKGLLGEASA
jgi:hypothetical protein